MSARKFRRKMSSRELQPEQVKRVIAALGTLIEREKGNRSAAARLLRISAPSVSNLMNGKNAPSYDTAIRISIALGISEGTLLGERPPGVKMPESATHPNLLAALDIAGDRATEGARRSVLAAAAYLPDVASSTWLALLFDPAHGK